VLLVVAAAAVDVELLGKPLSAKSRVQSRSILETPAASKSTKARVEAGEGVPFFDERLSCREDDGVWSAYRELVQYARLRIFGDGEGAELARLLSATLAARTANLTEILQCNVGVIAGYHLLARRHIAESDDWKAYRLLQLALIYVFTLRNALQIPSEAAHDWATRTDQIVQEIKLLRARLGREQARRVAWLPDIPVDHRVEGLRVAIVSICAYPRDHPLVLRTLTPENRKVYAERHGYSLHVHMKHPMPGQDVHVQHAKLGLVASYLRMGIYDWVAWLDCDSIIMNLNRTLDSIIYRYARQSVRPHTGSVDGDAAALGASAKGTDTSYTEKVVPAAGRAEEATPDLGEHVLLQADEPGHDEELEAFVYHIGSCNTDAGCSASVRVRVNRLARYVVTVSTALVDMEAKSEKLASITVGGRELGECNPAPSSDYDCGYHDCFQEELVPVEAVSSGFLVLEARSVRTNDDCRCSRLLGSCYSAAVAMLEEHSDGEKTTDPSYGMFVKFTLTPQVNNSAVDVDEDSDLQAGRELDSCSCRRPSASEGTEDEALLAGEEDAVVVTRNAECEGPDVLLGLGLPISHCLSLCREIEECRFVLFGTGRKEGHCYWELGDCTSFEEDSYIVLDVRAGATPQQECAQVCDAAAAVSDASEAKQGNEYEAAADFNAGQLGGVPGDDHGVDLLITEEGWGMSSANWLIRRSAWSIKFLERAFQLCHRELPLFGDQDAMIHLLLNQHALRHDFQGDPLDPHAVIIPQRELNAYDALNAHYMGCDGYTEGDLLVTFPGCKDPEACNPLFKLAAEYALRNNSEAEEIEQTQISGAHIRLFGPPDVAAAVYEAARERRDKR